VVVAVKSIYLFPLELPTYRCLLLKLIDALKRVQLSSGLEISLIHFFDFVILLNFFKLVLISWIRKALEIGFGFKEY